MNFVQLLDQMNRFVWGPPLLTLLVGTGVLLTVRLGLIQLFKLPQAVKLIFKADNKGEGDISSFGALWKYYWSGDCDFSGRTRSTFLDVVSCVLWHGNEVCRRRISH